MKPTIIVIGSSDVIKLGLIRSFGESGYKIISIHAVGTNKFKMKPLDYYSKYIRNYYFVKTTNLIDLLIDKCTDEVQKPILLPLSDNIVYLIDQSLSKLSKFFVIPSINGQEGGITRLMNKILQKKIATEVGLNVPKTWEIPFVDGTFIIPKDIEYPCFVKGAISYKSKKKYQKKCNNSQELNDLLSLCKQVREYDLCVEEYLDIDKEVGIMAISSITGCVTPTIVNLLDMGKGSTNGVSMRGEICSMDNLPELTKAISSFLAKLCFTGICNLDFIESEGKIYFVEVNFRYAAYGYAIFKSGVSLPEMIVNSLHGNAFGQSGMMSDRHKTYFNEKIGLINVVERSITYKKYREMTNHADILMIEDSSDPKPHKMMRVLIINYMMNCVIRKIKAIVTLIK
mgnify:CR=1 FL=1